MRIMGRGGYYAPDDLKVVDKVIPGAETVFQEPFWTNLELEIFWHVLQEHVENLLKEASCCPDPDIAFCDLDPTRSSDYDRCLHRVQELTWCGRYSLAVANFLAARRYFRDCLPRRYADCLRPDDVEFLRVLFMRRMPFRRHW